MQSVAHRDHGSQISALAGYKARIVEEADRFAMTVGGLLLEARAVAPAAFNDWVNDELPFGLDTARRLMAIHQAYMGRPPEILAQLPRPWQALFALRHASDAQLAGAIETGELSVKTTEVQAKAVARRWRTGETAPAPRQHRADTTAGQLMQFSPSDVSPAVRQALRNWMRR